jgi:hypothetical protein
MISEKSSTLATTADGGREGFWTALTTLTVLTVLTADVVDEMDPVALCVCRFD